jgi:hypothetical protein
MTQRRADVLAGAVFSDHAFSEMARRNLSESEVRGVLASPDSVMAVRPGRVVVQGMTMDAAGGRPYLIRVFVDIDSDPSVVVTAYRTSKLAKYRGPS